MAVAISNILYGIRAANTAKFEMRQFVRLVEEYKGKNNSFF